VVRVGLQIGIDPWDVGRWTPAEVKSRCEFVVEERRTREATAWVRTAWQTSYLMQPHLKKSNQLKVEDMLPDDTLIAAGVMKPKPDAPPIKKRQEMWDELMKTFEGVT
jgi:hypothetical protein